MIDALVLVADGRIMGEVRRDDEDRLALVYDAAWRALPGAWPLSLSMPLLLAEHEHGRVEPWLRRLLPDDDVSLMRWARRYGAAPRSVFDLLAAVGEDCPGAVQLVRPDSLDAVLDGKAVTIEWQTRGVMADRLRALRKDPAACRLPRDVGHFTLGGARSKIALVFNGQHWGVPSGRTPTTHILVQPADLADGYVHNEHLCLRLARMLGLPAVHTQIATFEEETALAVERYDRLRDNGTFRRLHQEDLGQAMGLAAARNRRLGRVPPTHRMVELLRAHSGAPQDDVWTLVHAAILNWLIAGGPLTLRSFSILIGAEGRVRLAPLHQLHSTLPDRPQDAIQRDPTGLDAPPGSELAGQQRWQQLAAAARLPALDVLDAARDLAGRVPDAVSQVMARARAEGTVDPAMSRLAELLAARARRCARQLAF